MSVLLVPIHLDALVLRKEEPVVEEMTDYTKLPYFNQRHSPQNIRNPYLGDTVLSPPFENPNLTLDAGIHLHWALPEGLTRGVSKELENRDIVVEFPLVPNRWLIIRSGGNQEKQWVVESDYLYPEGKEWVYGTVNILHEPDEKKGSECQPFRFLGRKLELSEWNLKDSGAEYLEQLTVIGPKAQIKMLDNEKVTFAAFYPNCRSVFGFHDADYAGQTPPQGLQYEVIGWYSDREKDCLTRLKKDTEVNESQTWLEVIKEKFGWTVAEKAEKDLTYDNLQRVLCYARLRFANSGSLPDRKNGLLNPTIAVGNTGSEALVAYLAHESTKDKKGEEYKKSKELLEEQLEALQLSDRLEQETLDIFPKFKEAQHEQGFFASSSGVLWRVVPEGNKSAPADAAEEEGQLLVSLPNDIAEKLGTLNHLQQDYDKALAEIGAMREQVYADWYKYMIEVPRSGEFDERIKFFMQTKVIPDLTKKLSDTGDLGKIIRNETANSNNQSTASKLAQSIKNLSDDLTEFNKRSRFQVDSSSSKETDLSLEVEGKFSLVNDLEAGKCLSLVRSVMRFPSKVKVKAISIWVKRLNSSNSSLTLASQVYSSSSSRTPLRYIYNVDWKPTMKSVFVNGEKKDQLNWWQEIPKDKWTLVYLEFPQELNYSIELLFDSFQVNERVASVRLHQQTLTKEQIQHDFREKTYFFKPTYTLKATSGPRYWQPNDPVILMVGEAVTPTSRQGHDSSLGEDGSLKCSLLVDEVNWQNLPESRNIIKTRLDAIALKSTDEKIGFYRWKQQPWNPFLLEWGVRLYSCSRDTTPPNSDYKADHIEKNYTLPVNAIDLEPKNGVEDGFFEGISSYQGASLLSPTASTYLKEKFATYLNKKLLPDYYKEYDTPEEEQTKDYLNKYFKTIKDRYEQKLDSEPKSNQEKDKDPIYTALRAYEKLQSLKCLAQALGGFNDYLLTYQRTLQLEIRDPFAAPPENKDQHEQNGRWQFTQEVRKAVADSAIADQLSLLRSPYINNDFNPIRNGVMNISGLRIVDTFGRFKVVVDPRRPEATEVVTIESLASPDKNLYQIYLPPRIVQPARLNFRWLSATHSSEEMNDHPATTPICGWLVPNNFNSSLMVYDSQGSPLGIIDRNARWQEVPGILAKEINKINNSYLRTLVNFLTNQRTDFLENFLKTLNSALETIDPEAFAQHQGLALLIGRPIALVRAKVNLELQGPPAVNQSDKAMEDDVRQNNSQRRTDSFTKVKFPIRIGEHNQLDDGLVGYWIEEPNGTYKENTFYAPQSSYVEHHKIKTLYENKKDEETNKTTPVNLVQTLEPNTAHTLAMLIDPRSKVHASCGVLPSKAIQIPPEQFQAALEAIQVVFFTGPILSDSKQLNVTLPEETGYAWTWCAKDGDAKDGDAKDGNRWSKTDKIGKFSSQATFSTSSQKIYEGWLELVKSNPEEKKNA